MDKTPTSILHEYCTKHKITPVFDLLATEGASHQPNFVYKLTVGSHTATGKGISKKKAKHAAAIAVLPSLLDVNDYRLTSNYSKEYGQSDGREDSSSNPIGQLQEFSQKFSLRPPTYDFEQPPLGQSLPPDFLCRCKLGNITEMARAKSKKQAKRKAAELVLAKMSYDQPESNKAEAQFFDESDDDVKLILQEHRRQIAEKKTLPSVTPTADKRLSKFYEAMAQAQGKYIERLRAMSLNSPTMDFVNALVELAKEQKFEVSYVDIKEVNTRGMCQCLLQLTTFPVAVLHGVGPSFVEAHADAAHNALQYLKIMTISKGGKKH